MFHIGVHYEYPFGGMCNRPEWIPKGREDWIRDLDMICDTGFSALRIRIGFDCNLDEVEELMNLAWDRRLCILFGFAAFYVPDSFVDKYPDSKIIGEDGAVVPADHDDLRWQRACIDHPQYQQARNELVGQCALRFSKHPALIAWCIHNEPSAGPVSDPCYCEHTVAKYRTSLKARFGTMECLNASLHTQYASFEALNPPRSSERGGPFWADWRCFIADNLTAFLNDGRDIIRKFDASHPVTYNVTFPYLPGSTGQDWWAAKNNDLLSMSMYMEANEYAVTNSLSNLALLRSLDPAKDVWITEFQGGPMPVGNIRTLLTGKEMALQLNSVLGHGVKGVFHYRWEPLLSGAEPMINGLIDVGRYDTDRRMGLKKAIEELTPYYEFLSGAQSIPPRIGICITRNQVFYANYTERTRDLCDAVTGAYAMLSDLGYEAGFIPHPVNADCEYEAVILPYMDGYDGEYRQLMEFVRRGGTLITALPVNAGFEATKKTAMEFDVSVDHWQRRIYLLTSGWDLRSTGNDLCGPEDAFCGFAMKTNAERISFVGREEEYVLKYGDNQKTAAILPKEYHNRLFLCGFGLFESYKNSLHHTLRELIGRYLARTVQPDVIIEGIDMDFRPYLDVRILENNGQTLLFLCNRCMYDFDLRVEVRGETPITCTVPAYDCKKILLQ